MASIGYQPIYEFGPDAAHTLAHAGYIFSLPANLKIFREYAHKTSQAEFEKVTDKITNEWKKVLKYVRGQELAKAQQIYNAMGVPYKGNVKEIVLSELNKMIETEPGKHNDRLDMELFIATMYSKAMEEDVDLSKLTFEGISKTGETRVNAKLKNGYFEVKKFHHQVLDTLQKVTSNQKVTLSPLHENAVLAAIRAVNISREELEDLYQYIKGYTQEAYIAQRMSMMSYITSIDTSAGTVVDPDKLEERAVALIDNFLTRKGLNTAAGTTGIDSDLLVTFQDGTTLGVSIKTTVDSNAGSVLYRVSRKLGENKTFADVQKETRYNFENIIAYARTSVFSHYMINGSFYGTDQVLRPIAYLILNSDEFINAMVDKKLIGLPEFHYILNVNNRFYWFSDLLDSIVHEITNYKGKAYQQHWGIDNLTLPDVSKTALLEAKRSMYREGLRRNMMTYESRIGLVLGTSPLKDWFEEGKKLFDSASLKVEGARFRILRSSPESMMRAKR